MKKTVISGKVKSCANKIQHEELLFKCETCALNTNWIFRKHEEAI